MELEISAIANGSSPEPVGRDEFCASFSMEKGNSIVERATQIIEHKNQTSIDSDDDLMDITPDTVEIKREQQELSLGWAKNCDPNVIIDLMDDKNTIIMKTEVNNENLNSNRSNAMKRPLQRNIMTKKPQKPIVERCVGRIVAPKKQRPLNAVTIGSRRMNAGGVANGAAAATDNDISVDSDNEDESVGQTVDQEQDNESGLSDAIDMDLGAFLFQDQIADIEVAADRQSAVNSIPNESYCQICHSQHTNKKALQSHYITKKHTSKVYELARQAAHGSGTLSTKIAIQNPVQKARGVSSLYCKVCEFEYSSKKTMTKHLRSKKHKENLVKIDPFELD